MASDGWPIVSWPSKVTDPVRFSTMPITDLSVVVLPAPLRPSSVTSSPRPISKPTPCRMCDSPYQACRPSTLSNASTMASPDVGFDYCRVLRHGSVRPFSQHLAARQHGDGIGKISDHGHVVLNHQHRTIARHGADEGSDALDVL